MPRVIEETHVLHDTGDTSYAYSRISVDIHFNTLSITTGHKKEIDARTVYGGSSLSDKEFCGEEVRTFVCDLPLYEQKAVITGLSNIYKHFDIKLL